MFRVLLPALLFISLIANGQNETAQPDSLKDERISDYFSYGSRGFNFTAPGKEFSLNIQSRLQFRYAYPNDENPVTFQDFRDETRHLFKINRARLKVGGHGYKPWLKYYWEYEISAGVLLDYRMMIERWKFFNVKVGQWKADFTRERTISSGAQQTLDRSIINRTFTIDRQQGVAFYGRVREGKPGDFNYWLSVFTGSGRGARFNEDEDLMYVAKLQWNVLGREVEMSGSDLDNRPLPDLSIAAAALTTRGRFTRFSTSGGGQLVGFDSEDPGDYRINQVMFETAFKYRGFAWQHESHRKEIEDRINNTVTTLSGSYFQAGYFLHNALPWVPEKLELAMRYAYQTIPTETRYLVDEQEFATAINYFFAGHKNKLTIEFARLYYQEDSLNPDATANRFRIQWDISI